MSFCPSCGFNLDRDKVLQLDGFTLDPRGEVHFGETRVELSHHEALVMHTVAAAAGRPVKTETIACRVSDGEDPHCASVFIHRARRRLLAAGIPNPIQTAFRRGYRWSVKWVS